VHYIEHEATYGVGAWGADGIPRVVRTGDAPTNSSARVRAQTAKDLGCGPKLYRQLADPRRAGSVSRSSLTGEREPIRGWKLEPKSFQKVDPRGRVKDSADQPASGWTARRSQERCRAARRCNRRTSSTCGFRMNSREQGDYEFDINGVEEVQYYPDLAITVLDRGASHHPPLPKIWAYPHPESPGGQARWIRPCLGRVERPVSVYGKTTQGDPAIEANWVSVLEGRPLSHPLTTGEIYASGPRRR